MVLVITLFLCYFVQFLHSFPIIQAPVSTNATLGSNAQFYCAGIVDNLYWDVDGTPHQNVEVKSRGITATYWYISENDTLGSVLTVPCEVVNNHTSIKCVVFKNVQLTYSSAVSLLIQGFLSSVTNLSTKSTPDKVILTWLAPYSLVGIPIQGYGISVFVSSPFSNTPLINNTLFINQTVYIVMKSELFNCSFVNVSIYPVNSVGNGESVNHSAVYVEDPSMFNWFLLDTSSSVDMNFTTHIHARILAETQCTGTRPTSASLIVHKVDDVHNNETCASNEIYCISGKTNTFLMYKVGFIYPFAIGSSYNGVIMLSNSAGSVQLDGVVFNTVLMKTAIVSLNPQDPFRVCVTCTFTGKKDESFCFVTTEEMFTKKQYMFVAMEMEETNFSVNCTDELPSGTYTVTVYDHNLTTVPAIVYGNLTITSNSIVLSTMTTATYIMSQSSTPVVGVDRAPLSQEAMYAIVSVGAATTLAVLIAISFIIVIVRFNSKRHAGSKAKEFIKTGKMKMADNEAYATVTSFKTPVGSIRMDACEAYGVFKQ